ncbi:MAG: iron-sulfur cluster repair di-iron protein [Bacteroidetes bacterium]|nr:iron-sulfur cluster repair di-iron protein [Bacteroidota bacterium]
MNESLVIDVTVIEARLKHPTIFNAFDQLDGGDAILLHNDHDPKPLYYQLLGERGNCFSWAYKQSGPEIWEVEIRKNVPGKQAETLGEIASKDLRKAEVFKKMGLDFCCGGKKSLEDACKEKGLDLTEVKAALENVSHTQSTKPSYDFSTWPLSFLSDYIVNVHHAYVNQNMPLLLDLSQKVAGHHRASNPELKQVYDKVDEMFCELKIHLKKEENILFPYIKQLENAKGSAVPRAFASVRQPVSVMEHDHDIVGDLAKEIRTITNNYSLPANACNSYALLYKKLEEFEDDLHVHIHLENNILFPKAIEMENAL